MAGAKPAAGGGVRLEVEAGRIPGWITRFSARNGGIAGIEAMPQRIVVSAADGTKAVLEVPFAPMSIGDREPLQALLDHLTSLGEIGIVLVRAGAHSVGIARDGEVLRSSTHRPYVQGRTAAGGWSQQRYARRRGNQLDFSLAHAADLTVEVVVPQATRLQGLALGGDRAALDRVLQDRRLAPLLSLPRRIFPDIPEPRRVVLDDIARRSLTVPIHVAAAAS